MSKQELIKLLIEIQEEIISDIEKQESERDAINGLFVSRDWVAIRNSITFGQVVEWLKKKELLSNQPTERTGGI